MRTKMYILQIFPPSDPIYYDIWIIYLFSSTTDWLLYYVRREWETCCSVSRYSGLDTHLHHLTLTIHINRRTSLIHSQPTPTPTQTYSTRYLKNVDSKMDSLVIESVFLHLHAKFEDVLHILEAFVVKVEYFFMWTLML